MLVKCHVSRNEIKIIELAECSISTVLEKLSRYASKTYEILCDFMITHVSEMLLYLKLSFHSIETNGKIHADNF